MANENVGIDFEAERVATFTAALATIPEMADISMITFPNSIAARLMADATEEEAAYAWAIHTLARFLGLEHEIAAKRFAEYIKSQPLVWRQCFTRIVAWCPDAIAVMLPNAP